jgi:putative heme iron utilization protein
VNDAASNARHARRYLRARQHGVLSTLSRRFAGYPYGSAVPFVLDHEAQPVILVSRLAEHTRNLEADARTSLVVRDDGDDVQAGARLTLLGNAARIDCDPPLRERFLRYHPQARQLLGLGDFSYWRITPMTLRFIAGFGTIRWVSASEFAPPPHAFAQFEADIVAQVNAGQPDALRACCRGSIGREVDEAKMLGIDCDGFDVRVDGLRLRFDFPETALQAESARRAIAEMIEAGPDLRTP